MVWRIELFGGLRAIRGDRALTRFRTLKTGALLGYLSYFLPRAHPRGELVELFWPELTPEAGRDNLSVALSSLRRQLEPPGVPPGAVIVADRHSVQLNPAACVTDVIEFQAAIQAATRAQMKDERSAQLAEAVDLYGGELLPGCLDEWALRERQHLAEEHLGAVRQLVSMLEQAGDLDGALEYARRAVRADPLSEEAHYDLMRLYASAGQPAVALGQYQRLEDLLRVELGETPSAETRALAEELRRNPRTLVVAPSSHRKAVSSAAASPPQASAPARLSPPVPPLRLPPQFTRFFGREEEIARVEEALSCPERRLLTLTGPGGSGKTRLGIAVAGRMHEAFGERIAFVPLADLTDACRIPDTIFGVLGEPRSAGLDPLEQVIALLSQQPWLLLLDNLEHLLGEGALLVKSLLERVGTLTCLVTSRQRLNLAGEEEFAVLPLPTPRKADTPERLMEYASVRLFVDRAQAARPDFQITAGNAEAVASLCDRLEGIPLALELAAARVSVLTPAQMLSRLDQRFELLVSRQRGASSRHRTLRSAIDWSHELLSPELQRFFARLSVFRGGWSLEDAEAACDEPGALEYLEIPREGSLVLGEEAGEEIRYRLLETVREFGAEQLSATGQEQLSRRHAEYFLAFAEMADPMLVTAEQAEWLERLEREHDNFRRALDWAVAAGVDDAGAARIGLRLGAALGRFWTFRGFTLEGLERYSQLLALPGCPVRTAARAKSMVYAAEIASSLGDYRTARPFAEGSLAISRELGDAPGIAHSCGLLGWILKSVNDYPAALALAEESLAISRGLSRPYESARALRLLAEVCRDQGKASAVRIYLAESLALFREIGDGRGLITGLAGVATQRYLEGDFPAARAFFEEALEIGRRQRLRSTLPGLLQMLADVARCEGDYDRATLLCQEALPLWLQAGDRTSYASTLLSLADAELQQGRIAEATSRYVEGLALCREMGSVRYGVSAVAGLAGIARRIGRLQEDARLLGAVEALCEARAIRYWTADRLRNEREVAAVRVALPTAEVADLRAEGRSLSIEEAIATALDAFR